MSLSWICQLFDRSMHPECDQRAGGSGDPFCDRIGQESVEDLFYSGGIGFFCPIIANSGALILDEERRVLPGSMDRKKRVDK